ncbi:hypothetical protein [Nocardia terpenica]|uniref:Uncharacterized protein n=1 Tax=Nocardia terpenica TaxID=455432 RepID=A0A6G9Z511_9NOCA|nr:hypothetical protein [Nocardia terpenica]QIS20520.1 hypothetical protein F6W96_21695 [Nocardia terpenica]
MVITLPGGGAVLVVLAAVPGHVPAYSRSEVWIGTGILLCLLVGLLIVLLRSSRSGPRHAFGRGRRVSPSSRGRRRILRRPGRR